MQELYRGVMSKKGVFLLKRGLYLSIAATLLFWSCGEDNGNPVTPVKDIEILKPFANDEFFPEDLVHIIAKYNINTVSMIQRLNCLYSLDSGMTWSDSMAGIFRSEVYRDSEYDYVAFRWYPMNDKLSDTTIYIKVGKYADPTVHDIVGPIKIMH